MMKVGYDLEVDFWAKVKSDITIVFQIGLHWNAYLPRCISCYSSFKNNKFDFTSIIWVDGKYILNA